MWNVTSLVHKTEKIMEHILDRDPDVVFYTETWLTSDCNHVTALVKTYGYKLLHNRRKNRLKETGGGVGLLVKSNIGHKHMKSKTYSSFESTVVKLFLTNNKSITLLCIYRLLFVPITVFLEEIVQLFEVLVATCETIIVAGDVNIHTEMDETYPTQFNEILDMFNMTQHVHVPTHKMGHTLDIVATFNMKPGITNIIVNEYEDISHHFLVDFTATCAPEVREYKVIKYRNIKAVDSEKFDCDVKKKLNISTAGTFGQKVKHYNEVMAETLEKHAPLKTKKIKIVPDTPWFDGEYANLRRLRRKAEKLFRKTGLLTHKENYINLRKQTTTLAYEKKRKYYDEKLSDMSNSKTFYSVVNKLLDNKQEVILPSSRSDKELANSFMDYFLDKILMIRSKFADLSKTSDHLTSNLQTNVQCLSTLERATEDEIRQIVLSFGVKCSPEDPIPAKLLKRNLEKFIPIWLELVNLSLEQGSMDCLKNAIIIPLIKELDDLMDNDVLKNYRPVSNLLFLGKLIERIVSIRLNKHMTDNNLHSHYQHGYKKGHSTETLLLKVVNDLLLACDEHKPTILMLLDLSAAFDTVDQSKLLAILENEIGIVNTALKWFKSFLSERSQKVKIGDSYSNEAKLPYGVAQGSVLGPDLFNIYIRSLYPFIQPAKFDIFGFADDHQLLKSFLPIFQAKALDGDINRCFNMISKWMCDHFLCLNPAKTKILVIMPPSLKENVFVHGTFIDNNCVRFVTSAKNLGVILDDELSFQAQITAVVKSCFNTIRKLSKIKSFLTYEHMRTLISACVFSKLDYGNALYYGINSQLIRKLQAVQNSAVRLIRSKENRADMSIDGYLRRFHWLPVKERIIFKVVLLLHKCLNGNAPVALSQLFKYGSSSRTLKLNQLRSNNVYGDRAFSKAGPKLWNLLPGNIRMENNTNKFKILLKTYLFKNSSRFFEKLKER